MDAMGDLSHSEYTGEKVLAQYKMHDTFMETREEAGAKFLISFFCKSSIQISRNFTIKFCQRSIYT